MVKPQDRLIEALPTPEEIYDRLDRYVIGQTRAKRVMALAAYNHLKRVSRVHLGESSLLRKSNVLLIGPTGVGKTHLARTLATLLDLPFVVVDATEYTEAGYYGKDTEVMVGELLHAADLNTAATERGIIFVDEIDKVARRSGGMRTGAGNRDIGGEGVQQSLLKLLEGRRLFVPMNVTQHWNKHDFVEIDTSNILFICAGTFTDLRGRWQSGPLGFSKNMSRKVDTRRVTHKQLLEYGLLAELLGRLPVVAQLDVLGTKDLERILTEPQDSLYREYKELFSLDQVKLEISRPAMHEIADFAFRRRVGARGLRAILEEILHDDLFNAPALRGKSVKYTPAKVKSKLENFDSGMLNDD